MLTWIGNFKFFLIILLVIGLAIFILNKTNETTYETVYDEVQKQRVITEEVPVVNEMNYANLGDPYELEGKGAKLTGYLTRYVEGDKPSGMYQYGIMDDYGNIIEFEPLGKTEMKIFPITGKSTQIYEVEGNFTREYKTTKFDVSQLGIYEGQTQLIEKTENYAEIVARNITEPKYPTITAFVTSIFGKD